MEFVSLATGGSERSNAVDRLTPLNMLMQLRKAANHELLLSGTAYNEDTLKEICVILHNDPSHSDADPALVLEDLCNLSDHQVHKVCRLYDVSIITKLFDFSVILMGHVSILVSFHWFLND